jgi:hypothetical protein
VTGHSAVVKMPSGGHTRSNVAASPTSAVTGPSAVV